VLFGFFAEVELSAAEAALKLLTTFFHVGSPPPLNSVGSPALC
jgi:hypothetical protein